MKEFKIGIIEDDLEELNSIKRTIYTHLFFDYTILYKDYDFNYKSLNYSDIIGEIKKDILAGNIMLLIIDNKLVVEGNRLKGTSIYDEVKKIASDFPVIIMTNYGDEAYDSDYVDPDKVYDKEKIFLNGEYTKEKIKLICLLIEKYNKLNELLKVEINMDEEKHRIWETYMPEFLKHDIDEYVRCKDDPTCTHIDCLLAEIYGSINAAYYDGLIPKEQADYLRNKYYFGDELDE